MNPYTLPLALLTFAGWVAVTPIWLYFLGTYGPSLEPAEQWLAAFMLPAILGLFLASWLQPR